MGRRGYAISGRPKALIHTKPISLDIASGSTLVGVAIMGDERGATQPLEQLRVGGQVGAGGAELLGPGVARDRIYPQGRLLPGSPLAASHLHARPSSASCTLNGLRVLSAIDPVCSLRSARSSSLGTRFFGGVTQP